MSQLTADIQAAFATRASRTVEVPEWKRTLTVFPLTIAQLTKIQSETDPFRRAARIVQVRAKTPEGSPLFDETDMETLCMYGIGDYGPVVIARVAAELMVDLPSAENVEKN